VDVSGRPTTQSRASAACAPTWRRPDRSRSGPNFEHAVRRDRLLDAIRQSSSECRHIEIPPRATTRE
jgi:hypothetical protein